MFDKGQMALCLTKVRSSRARCPATALIFFFLRFDSRFFPPFSSLSVSLFFSFLVSFFNPSSLVALVWFERGGDSKITG